LTEVAAASHLKVVCFYYFENRYISKSGKSSGLPGQQPLLLKSDLIFAVAKEYHRKKEARVSIEASQTGFRVGKLGNRCSSTVTVFWAVLPRRSREVDLILSLIYQWVN